VWFALFAARRARVSGSRAWAAVAAVTAFFALQIVASTVVLRWHYLVDVAAGLCLAAFAAWSAPKLASAERAFRARESLRPAWSFD
jgi:membrane-associated phospholipid phosphatase